MGKAMKKALIYLIPFLILAGCTSNNGDSDPDNPDNYLERVNRAIEEQQIFEAQQNDAASKGTQEDGYMYFARVIGIIDGDSIKVKMYQPMKENEFAEAKHMGWPIDYGETGKEEVIGLIGVDSPKGAECGSLEARTKLASIAPAGALMWLIDDSAQGGRDQNGRLLRYVWYEAKHYTVNNKLLAEGSAYESSFGKPYEYQSDMQQTQAEAKLNSLGVWNAAGCNGQR
ncbi:MAG: thermonuclease family protein [Thermoleophilia bacterium]